MTLNPIANAGQADVWFWRWYEVYKSVYSLNSAFRATLMKPFKLENIKGMERKGRKEISLSIFEDPLVYLTTAAW